MGVASKCYLPLSDVVQARRRSDASFPPGWWVSLTPWEGRTSGESGLAVFCAPVTRWPVAQSACGSEENVSPVALPDYQERGATSFPGFPDLMHVDALLDSNEFWTTSAGPDLRFPCPCFSLLSSSFCPDLQLDSAPLPPMSPPLLWKSSLHTSSCLTDSSMPGFSQRAAYFLNSDMWCFPGMLCTFKATDFCNKIIRNWGLGSGQEIQYLE